MNDDVETRMKLNAAAQARKLLYWECTRGTIPDDTVLKHAISRGVWRGSDMRLFEWLTREICVPRERALDLVTYAITNDFEDGTLYGIEPVIPTETA